MLALGLSEGEDVMIGSDRLTVEHVRGQAATLSYESETMINKYEIIPNMEIQVSPHCRVSLGKPKGDKYSVRDDGSTANPQLTICFLAPRMVAITRGHLFREWGDTHDKPKPSNL